MVGATNGPVALNTFLFVALVSFSSGNSKLPLYYGQIMENLPAGTVVDGVVLPVGNDCHVTELDIALEGKDASDFRLVYDHREQPLVLQSTKTLDREFVAVYDLKAVLSGCLVNVMVIKIKVLDSNDNIPQFINGKDTIEVNELTPVGSELARFSATDADDGKNGRITYYAYPKCPHLHIVPQTGQVMLVSSFKGVMNITVRIYAKDNGDIALIGNPVTLHLDVRRPAISKVRRPRAVSEEMFYTVTVSEDVKVGDMIFTVPDQKFEKRWFEVISEADSPVQIERDSGRLYLAHRLKSPAEVTIKIQNLRGDEWYRCRLTLTVPTLADLQWDMFPQPYLGAVGPDATAGSVVYRLTARQRDGTIGNAHFLLLDGGEESFEVDRSSGEVRTTGRPLTPSREYMLRVQAVDAQGRKGPPATVAILAGFRPPQFTNTSYTLSVPENTAVGQA